MNIKMIMAESWNIGATTRSINVSKYKYKKDHGRWYLLLLLSQIPAETLVSQPSVNRYQEKNMNMDKIRSWHCHDDRYCFSGMFPFPRKPLTRGIDSFTVYLHSHDGILLGDYARGLSVALKMGGNSHWSCEPTIHCNRGLPHSIFRPANHKKLHQLNGGQVSYSTDKS